MYYIDDEWEKATAKLVHVYRTISRLVAVMNYSGFSSREYMLAGSTKELRLEGVESVEYHDKSIH
jgi:hypothetical protein